MNIQFDKKIIDNLTIRLSNLIDLDIVNLYTEDKIVYKICKYLVKVKKYPDYFTSLIEEKCSK